MSTRLKVWQTLSELLQRLDAKLTQLQEAETRLAQSTPATLDTATIQTELRKLGKAQVKTNALAEVQAAHWQEALSALQAAPATESAVSREFLEAILPALDGLAQAVESGQQYLHTRQTETAVSTTDRDMLRSWLDGLQLIEERLLAVLEAGGVTPIPTVGQPFDPFRHRAVSISHTGSSRPGTIVSEDRPGYQMGDTILRYADVIVYKPQVDQDNLTAAISPSLNQRT